MSDTGATQITGPGTTPRPLRRLSAQNVRTRTGLLDVATLSRYRRRKLIRTIETRTERRLLCYVSSSSVSYFDTYHLARLLETVKPGERITLLLDSPGGDIDAAEKMVHLLREACAPPSGSAGDLEIVVPNAAKSAATLIALGADRILMSDSSELGPIDPQILFADGSSISAFALRRAYRDAQERCIRYPHNDAFAAELGKFDAVLVVEVAQAEERARKCAEKLLERQGANYTDVAATLMDVDRFPSHGQMIDWRTAKGIGIPQVHHLARNHPDWQRYWDLYRCLLPLSSDDGSVFESIDKTIIVCVAG